jgi:hypothetical protein
VFEEEDLLSSLVGLTEIELKIDASQLEVRFEGFRIVA